MKATRIVFMFVVMVLCLLYAAPAFAQEYTQALITDMVKFLEAPRVLRGFCPAYQRRVIAEKVEYQIYKGDASQKYGVTREKATDLRTKAKGEQIGQSIKFLREMKSDSFKNPLASLHCEISIFDEKPYGVDHDAFDMAMDIIISANSRQDDAAWTDPLTNAHFGRLIETEIRSFLWSYAPLVSPYFRAVMLGEPDNHLGKDDARNRLRYFLTLLEVAPTGLGLSEYEAGSILDGKIPETPAPQNKLTSR